VSIRATKGRFRIPEAVIVYGCPASYWKNNPLSEHGIEGIKQGEPTAL
jgi:hypothetical protein